MPKEIKNFPGCSWSLNWWNGNKMYRCGPGWAWHCDTFWLQGSFSLQRGHLVLRPPGVGLWRRIRALHLPCRCLPLITPLSPLLELDIIPSLSDGLTYSCSDSLGGGLTSYLPRKIRIEINFKSLKAAPILSDIPHTTWKEIWWLGGSPLAFNLRE